MEDSFYRDTILDHYHAPRNYGVLADFDAEVKMDNPLCGDEITVRLKFQGNFIDNIRFEHKGCVISRAAASLLSENIKGKTREEVYLLALPDMLILLGVTPAPARIKCAALALETIKKIV